ncbi:helix-turn-helix domain-containing protein [Elizabethkingia ursingii]
MDFIKKSALFFLFIRLVLCNIQIMGSLKSENNNKVSAAANVEDLVNAVHFCYVFEDLPKNVFDVSVCNFLIGNNSKIMINGIVPNLKNDIKIEKESNVFWNIIFICFGLLLFALLQVGYYYSVKRIIERKYLVSTEKIDKDYCKGNLPSDIEKVLLKKILVFENSEKFLKNNITLSYLSHLFNTNPKYLSVFIKLHRERNFNSYINYLRIGYICRKLCENSVYREYKISYLAEECGYASTQVFISAFRKETGVTPMLFVNKLKNQVIVNHS